MKKIVALLLVVLIMSLSCGSVFALAFADKNATATYGTPEAIDGVWEEVYSHAMEIPIAEVDDTYAPNTVPNECTGTAWLLWDEGFLYVYVDMKDPFLSAFNDGPSHLRDQMGIFLDEDYQTGTLDGVMESEKTDGYTAWVVEIIDNIEEIYIGEDPEGLYEAFVIAGDEADFTAEFKIPWSKIIPEEGTKIGWEIQYNDDPGVGTRDHIVNWGEGGEDCWQYPGSCGTVELVSTPELPSTNDSESIIIYVAIALVLVLVAVVALIMFKKKAVK